ncbi:MAG: family N-acetyltransferase [Acidimicrobiales bacterium]|nr:family N-acetyltransferase [Acidimicrobiales bacterium]
MPIRPYVPADRPAVRSICHRTGYMGEPVARLWRDEASFADLFSGYYTDEEPDSLLIAERDGEVVGYLLGCLDSRRPPHMFRVLGPHVLRRGLLVRPGTAGFMWRAARDIALDAARHDGPPDRVLDPRWPAHLHINLLPAARGAGLGGALVRAWLDRVRAAELPGCHLETLAENRDGIAFFEAMGFEREGPPHPVPGMRTPEGARNHVQLMVHPL